MDSLLLALIVGASLGLCALAPAASRLPDWGLALAAIAGRPARLAGSGGADADALAAPRPQRVDPRSRRWSPARASTRCGRS